jgi:YggT family protein
VNNIGCWGWTILADIVNIYTFVLLIYAVVSWIPNLRGRWVYYLARLVDPLLNPIRRVIPPVGGFDIAFLVLLLVLQFLVRPMIGRFEISTCYGYLP